MTILLVLFATSVLLELLPHIRILWPARRVLAMLALFVSSFFAGAIVVWECNLWSVLIAIICVYRGFNGLRIVEGRMHERYLQRSALRTSVTLVGLQLLLTLCWLGWSWWHETGHLVWGLLAGAQLVVAGGLLWSIARNLRRTAWSGRAPAISDADLPTLSVAIPARNETEDLQACLRSLVACDYPKLEILVLDDCSQLKRTPEIIRDFAHDGVRFIQGDVPPPTWLAKNHAYAHLAREASGEYILFCGVDVRFSPESLRQLVNAMLAKKKEMMCVLPWRTAPGERFAVIQSMRYFWELVPPRRLFRRPPVLSTCWVITKQALERAGGFVAVTRSIVPEAHFARQLVKTDTYSFMRASQTAGIESAKPTAEQYETAVRMRYPQLHRRPENVLTVSIAGFLFLLLPFALPVVGFWISIGMFAQVGAFVAALLLVATYARLIAATRTGQWWFGFIGMPFGVVYDLYMLHFSMFKYEFSEVDWKGRNVCIPAMHVIPHLPKI